MLSEEKPSLRGGFFRSDVVKPVPADLQQALSRRGRAGSSCPVAGVAQR